MELTNYDQQVTIKINTLRINYTQFMLSQMLSLSFDDVTGRLSGHGFPGHGIYQSKLTSWGESNLLIPFCFFIMSSIKSSSNFFARISAFPSIAIGELNHT